MSVPLRVRDTLSRNRRRFSRIASSPRRRRISRTRRRHRTSSRIPQRHSSKSGLVPEQRPPLSPNGAATPSPRLRPRGYLGSPSTKHPQPQRGCGQCVSRARDIGHDPVGQRVDVSRAGRARSADLQSISISPDRRRSRESLVLVVVLVLVIGNGAVEDEKEDEDDLFAAPPRCAVSQVFNLPPAACEQRSADYKSATCLPAGRYGRLKICAAANRYANGVLNYSRSGCTKPSRSTSEREDAMVVSERFGAC